MPSQGCARLRRPDWTARGRDVQFRRRNHAALPVQAQFGAFLLPHHPRRPDILLYTYAVLIGIVAALLVLPVQTILGAGPGWNAPLTDQAQTLAGHLAYQADAWRWPLLRAEPLFWPRGVSVALTDSNPLVSLLAKLWTKRSEERRVGKECSLL